MGGSGGIGSLQWESHMLDTLDAVGGFPFSTLVFFGSGTSKIDSRCDSLKFGTGLFEQCYSAFHKYDPPLC